ncbi:hypothetical protein EP331_05235 [bacterium]|nr:MAG: hypothetical protein EP331_05235 [bacterium]
MILLVDTMNVLHTLRLSSDKQSGIIQLISLFKQSNWSNKAKKTQFIIDGYSFLIPIKSKSVQFVFSNNRTADELIIERAKKMAEKEITIVTADSEIKQSLNGLGITFLAPSVFKKSSSIDSMNKKHIHQNEEKAGNSSVWFDKLLKIKFND